MVTKVFFMPISNDIDDGKMDELLSLIPSEKRAKIEKIKNAIDKKLSIYALALAIKITGKSDILYTENGKPYFKDNDLYFSIAHTKNAIALAVSEKPIGVDIEKIRDTKNDIAKRFFTSDENKFINSSSDKGQAFFEIWTKKEAYLKQVGTGLKTPLDSFCTMTDSLGGKFKTEKIEQYIISTFCEEMPENIIKISENEI